MKFNNSLLLKRVLLYTTYYRFTLQSISVNLKRFGTRQFQLGVFEKQTNVLIQGKTQCLVWSCSQFTRCGIFSLTRFTVVKTRLYKLCRNDRCAVERVGKQGSQLTKQTPHFLPVPINPRLFTIIRSSTVASSVETLAPNLLLISAVD